MVTVNGHRDRKVAVERPGGGVIKGATPLLLLGDLDCDIPYLSLSLQQVLDPARGASSVDLQP